MRISTKPKLWMKIDNCLEVQSKTIMSCVCAMPYGNAILIIHSLIGDFQKGDNMMLTFVTNISRLKSFRCIYSWIFFRMNNMCIHSHFIQISMHNNFLIFFINLIHKSNKLNLS